MGSIRFSLLGPLRVYTPDGCEVDIRGSVRRTLLAVLLLEAGAVVSVNRLVDVLWAVESDESVANLYNQVTRLRHVLPGEGDRIRTVPPGYLIEIGPGELDLHVFAQHCAAARAAVASGDWALASERYSAALALWRGDPLADIPTLAGLAETTRLEEERWAAVLGRGEAELELGRHAELISELHELTRQRPEHEALYRQLMLALYRSGRQDEAIEAYRVLGRRLDERSGLEPSAETRELNERIRREDPSLKPPSPRSESARARATRQQLPADTRLFTGRQTEVERLLELAKNVAEQVGPGAPGAVTISAVDGLGGVGKSALAVHVAHRAGGLFPDGRLFVDLRGHTRGLEPLASNATLGYLLRSLDVPEPRIPAADAERAALLRERLAGTRTLILLDNAASADQVRALLPVAPGCMVLVTSRVRFSGLPGVHAVSLDVLPAPAARDLVCLAAGQGRVRPEDPALDALVELCGGIPLALRIVAALLRHDRTLSAASLVEALNDRGDRLRNLRDDDRELTAVFESSYAALPGAARRALRLLGLIAGTEFGAHAAAALFDLAVGEAAEILASLVEHSLLMEPTSGRYQFHDLMRLYARETAERDEPQQSRHVAIERLLSWYAGTARSGAIVAYPSWSGQQLPPRVGSVEPLAVSDAKQALDWFDLERDHLLAAVEAAEREGLPAYGWLLPAVLWPFTELRGRFGERLLLAETGLRCAQVLQDSAARNLMLRSKSTALNAVGRNAEAIEVGLLSLAFTRREGTRLDEAKQLSNLAFAYTRNEQLEEAIDYGWQSLRLFEMLGEESMEIPARINLSGALITSGRAAEAIPIISRAVELSRRPGNGVHLGGCLGQLGATLAEQDPPDYHAAEARLLEALEVLRSVGNRHHEAQALAQLGVLCEATNRAAEALTYLHASRQLLEDLGFDLYHVFRDALQRLERGEAGTGPHDSAP
jgi:DNA-binding SARP family transcriptional activator